MWAFILVIIKLLNTFYWPLVIVGLIIFVIIFKYFTFYRTFDRNTIITISKNILYSATRDERDEPHCLFFGYFYIGYIYKSCNGKENILYCLCTENQFEKLKKTKDEIIIETDTFYNLYTRTGNFYNFSYKIDKIKCTDYLATDSQKTIINSVLEFYQRNNKCVIMVSGPPGTGKSSLGILIAKEVNGYLCETFNPTNPGDYLRTVRTQVNPTFKNPLILLLDEFDTLLYSIHKKQVALHENLPTEVYDKPTWNKLFDNIDHGIHPHLIVILTTNLTSKTIEKNFDLSFLRTNRVNIFVEISAKNEVSIRYNFEKKRKIFGFGFFKWLKKN
jgi:DNA replication protein DnaC